MQNFFDIVRAEATEASWSQGAFLARDQAVLRESADAQELVLRVRAGGRMHPTVVLYLEDEEWECDCDSAEDPCAHVAAAVIALHRAEAGKGAPPRPLSEVSGALHYALSGSGDGLKLTRIVRHGDSQTPLQSSLRAHAERAGGTALSPAPRDLEIEALLGSGRQGTLSPGVLRTLLRILEGSEVLTLDGEAISSSREKVVYEAHLDDDGANFRLRVAPRPAIDRMFRGGFALCGAVLHEVAPSHLDARERETLLGRGLVVTPGELPALLSETLPALQERMPVHIHTRRLPQGVRTPPRLQVECTQHGAGLSVMAVLVYGEPGRAPLARIDAGRLQLAEGAPVPLRDEAAEAELQAMLRREFGLVAGRRENLERSAALDFAYRARARGITLLGEAAQRFERHAPLLPECRIEGDGFRLRFHSPGAAEGKGVAAHGAREADPRAVLEAHLQGAAFAPLLGGGFAELPSDWLDRYGPVLRDLLAATGAAQPGEQIAPPASCFADLARLAAALEQAPPPGFEALRALLEKTEDLPKARLPEDLRLELRNYQQEGTARLQFLGEAGLGALLADDMGLGKTAQALCALQGRTLVVAPTSLLGGWRDEAARFRPALRVLMYHGAGRTLDAGADLTLTSYAILRRDQQALAQVEWDTVVLDEAQAVKNPESQAAQAAYTLRAQRRFALTGTPVENRLEELWSQFHFLNPGLLGGRSDFDARYAQPIAAGDEAAAAHLQGRIRPFVLRRRKAEVAPELPARSELTLHCVLSREERELYEAMHVLGKQQALRELDAGAGVPAALTALLRLRQACCHPRLLPGQSLERSAKLDVLIDRLETAAADGHKALVFSQWTGLLDLVEPRLQAAGLGFTRLDGATRQGERDAVVARFQAQDGPPVFLISLRAGGFGLNLTAADHVFLLDPWWNPAVGDQAADRAHRIGQQRPVLVHNMVAEDTVEERILELQQQKRALADSALEAGAAGITRGELLALLE